MAAAMEVESADVIKLILQYLKENNLQTSLKALQAETQVSLNTVTNIDTFVSDINAGRWDAVLQQTSNLRLPQEKAVRLYEQIVFELLELRDVDVARELLRTTTPFHILKKEDPERYLKLERLCSNFSVERIEASYGGISKEKRRAAIANDLVAEVSVAPPSRLLTVINQALKWQQYQGTLGNGNKLDLLHGGERSAKRDDRELPPKKSYGSIKFGKKSYAETARFSVDGQMLATGSVDGFLELWDFETRKLRKDLPYQLKEEFLMHDGAILSISFSRDGEMVATGSQDHKIKVWKIVTGQCLRRFERAHSDGVSCIEFSRDGTQILSGGLDSLVKIQGLKSGRTLKEFRGHNSYINTVSFSLDGLKAISGSSDGTVKVWDIKDAVCLSTFTPPDFGPGKEVPVHTVRVIPKTTDHLLVGVREKKFYMINLSGQLIKTFDLGDLGFPTTITCCAVGKGSFAYCGGEDGKLYVISLQSGKLESQLQVNETSQELAGIVCHPHRNIVATFDNKGLLKLWKG